MKKLNRKGFTLIELLAVIVILAIILVVTVPQLIQTTSNARVGSLYNLVKKSAENYDTLYIADMGIAITDDKVLGDIPEKVIGSWRCIGYYAEGDSTEGYLNTTKNLAEVLGFAEKDFILVGKEPDNDINDTTRKSITSDGGEDGEPTCSAIRMKNGRAEIILVAKPGGSYYVAQQYTYAINTDDSGKFVKVDS